MTFWLGTSLWVLSWRMREMPVQVYLVTFLNYHRYYIMLSFLCRNSPLSEGSIILNSFHFNLLNSCLIFIKWQWCIWLNNDYLYWPWSLFFCLFLKGYINGNVSLISFKTSGSSTWMIGAGWSTLCKAGLPLPLFSIRCVPLQTEVRMMKVVMTSHYGKN